MKVVVPSLWGAVDRLCVARVPGSLAGESVTVEVSQAGPSEAVGTGPGSRDGGMSVD